MSSPAPKQAETEFDDLLGQLVDELAMTPASESAVQLVPEPPTEARVDSTHQMAAEAAAAAAAAAARAQQPAPSNSNNLVKIVGIIAGSLTIVAVAALAVFAKDGSSADDAGEVAIVDADNDRLAELAATEQAAVERAEAEHIAAERAEIAARVVRIEAGLLTDELKAKQEEAAAKAPKPRPRTRSKPKPKPKPKTKPGDSFEDL